MAPTPPVRPTNSRLHASPAQPRQHGGCEEAPESFGQVLGRLHNSQKNITATPIGAISKNAAIFTEEAGLRLSKHAAQRLKDRDIALSPQQLGRVEQGIKTAEAKGINDSLVMVDEIALVVNVPSKTIITAMAKQVNIFTNIDGAVVV